MKLTAHYILLGIAVLCFLLAAGGYHDRFTSLGLAFLALALFLS